MSVLEILGVGFILFTKVSLSKFIELLVSTSNLHFCPFIKISVFGGFLFTWCTVIPKEVSVSEISTSEEEKSDSMSTCLIRLSRMSFCFFLKHTARKCFFLLQ